MSTLWVFRLLGAEYSIQALYVPYTVINWSQSKRTLGNIGRTDALDTMSMSTFIHINCLIVQGSRCGTLSWLG